ncbi:MAG: hypothetical protein H0X36_05990 [Sphingomonadaceae bacterium]|nr:hypothetical protein [Sphingomonadaceae bacterium]
MNTHETRQAEQRQVERRVARDPDYAGPERRLAERRIGERRKGRSPPGRPRLPVPGAAHVLGHLVDSKPGVSACAKGFFAE